MIHIKKIMIKKGRFGTFFTTIGTFFHYISAYTFGSFLVPDFRFDFFISRKCDLIFVTIFPKLFNWHFSDKTTENKIFGIILSEYFTVLIVNK